MLQQQLRFAPFRNQGLFTDHYLQDVLPEDTALWTVEGLDQVRAELTGLWQREAAKVAGYNEAQLEEHFIRPVLQVLGQVWEVQPAAGSHQPDYGFFADGATRDEAKVRDRFGGKVYWSHALAVGDAKTWERKLDKQLAGGGAWDFVNPSFQVYYYLAETGCRWALLTNGRHWRLYSGDPKPDMQAFYEVDLPALLEQGEPADLAYFWLFFRGQAFLPDPDGRSFLERVRAESDLAADKLREDVREGVYRALLEACRGFVAHTPNGLAGNGLEVIYDNALVFLYRLLFVLYAEAAELLPLRDNAQYRDRYSLHAIKQEVADNPAAFPDGVATVWPKLKALFGVIDRGHPGLGVPAYNGGLFDPAKHPFLDQYEMADQQVARVVDLLARTPEGAFVDYRDLGVRHLGSIYEGLLEYKLALATEPMVVIRDQGKEKWVPAASADRPAAEHCETGELYLVTDKGERKATGSYYTPQFIVEYVVEHTLGPLVKRCQTAEQVLQLKVLDPAMGSGHFLVEATDFLARKLLERGGHQGEDLADDSDLSQLKRLVVERCIYGVDINPLAVELAKLSLWLDTVAKGQPLSFLDHHLRCGNSLIGARVEDLRCPPQARRARGRQAARDQERGAQALFDEGDFTQHMSRLVFGFGQIAQGLSDSREAVQTKGRILAEIEQAEGKRFKEIGNLWCSAHFGNAVDARRYSLLSGVLQRGEEPLSPDERTALQGSRELAGRYRFLHWELEFPTVFFDEHGRRNPQGGFDAVIGNPPWERMKLQENEFFALREPTIALAPTAARRKTLIVALPQTDPELWAEYQQAKAQADLEMAWTRDSGQYPFMGRGDTNLYAVMTERGRSLLAARGREGLVVPSGIATDNTTSAFFADLVETRTLQALLDFENRQGAFPDVDSRFKFSIIILTGGEQQEAFACGFFLHNAGDLADLGRVFSLHPEDCALMNPNTRTCPVFRSREDLELTRAIYQRVPVLVREAEEGEQNLWGVHYMRMFDMTLDSALFRPPGELEAEGFYPVAGNVWRKGAASFLPLYEGKMVQMYDHRAASVTVNPDNLFRPAQPEPTTRLQHESPGFSAVPRLWVSSLEIDSRQDNARVPWLLALKHVSSPTNERTMIAAIVPPCGAGNSLPVLFFPGRLAGEVSCFLSNLSALVFDFVLRQKMGGQNLNWFLLKQLPVLPPARHEEDFHGVRLGDFIGQRVLELSYTAHDLAGFAEDMGYVDGEGKPLPPFPWDEERRLHLRCQLDALYFHLYGLTRDEADYVLGTFPIVERRDQERYGRFRTRDLILHYYNAYSAGDMAALVQG